MGTLADDLTCLSLDNGAYPPLSDSRNVRHSIRSLMGFSNLVRPLALSVLYPYGLNSEASPRTISGRTSYLWVRLAFHPYPQLIQRFCNNDRFGPPRKFSCASAWPWIDHPVSGLMMQTLVALFRLAFAKAPGSSPLTCLHHKLAGSLHKRHAIRHSACAA